MYKFWSVAILGLSTCVRADAQQPPPSSAYCVSASRAFMMSAEEGYASLSKCKPGDTISLGAGSYQVLSLFSLFRYVIFPKLS
jgi:hypothetical protein